MQYWLFKSEPDCFSVDDLARQKTAGWDGTRNYQVRNMMRDQMRVGDLALFYHSSAGAATGCVGVMEIASAAKVDPTQFDPKSDHPDPKSDPNNPRWLLVDVTFVEKFATPVLLSELKLDPAFTGMPLLQRGNRLSVFPISATHFKKIRQLGRQGT